MTGDTASDHQTYSRLVAVSNSSRSAVVSGGHAPPGHCAHTRIVPELGHHGRRPTVRHSFLCKPILGEDMVLMLWHQQRDEHIHVQERDHKASD